MTVTSDAAQAQMGIRQCLDLAERLEYLPLSQSDHLHAELTRLQQIEIATRLVWSTHFSFPQLAFVPESPLDLLCRALEAKP